MLGLYARSSYLKHSWGHLNFWFVKSLISGLISVWNLTRIWSVSTKYYILMTSLVKFTPLQIAVLVNGFVLAFTSDFIPRVVYRHQISPDGSLNGYVNWTLSYFNVKDFKPQEWPDDPKRNVKEESRTCRYVSYC